MLYVLLFAALEILVLSHLVLFFSVCDLFPPDFTSFDLSVTYHVEPCIVYYYCCCYFHHLMWIFTYLQSDPPSSVTQVIKHPAAC